MSPGWLLRLVSGGGRALRRGKSVSFHLFAELLFFTVIASFLIFLFFFFFSLAR